MYCVPYYAWFNSLEWSGPFYCTPMIDIAEACSMWALWGMCVCVHGYAYVCRCIVYAYQYVCMCVH